MPIDRRSLLTAGAALGTAALSVPASARLASSPAAKGVVLHEKTYFMPAPIDATWDAMNDPAKRAVWFGFGSAGTGKPPAKPERKYFQRGVVDHPGLPGPTETTTTMKATKGGTLVTQTMVGLGDPALWRFAVDPGEGISDMMGDLALYLRTGAGFPRHTKVALPRKLPHPNDLTSGTRNAPGGVEVLDAPAGTLAAEIGLQPGDIVVALGEVGIYSLRDIQVALLGHAPGDVVEVAWIRAGKVMKGKGSMVSTPIKWRNGFDPAKAIRDNAERRKPE